MAYAEPSLPPPGANTAYLPDSTPRSGGLILYAKTIAKWTPNAVALFFGNKETDTLTTRRRQAACLTALLGGECSVSRLKDKGGGHRHVVTACAHTRWCYSVHYAFRNRAVRPRRPRRLHLRHPVPPRRRPTRLLRNCP